MPVQHLLCISIDGLRASALGAYGNTWHGTPALDALAAQSHVFDWMICDRPTGDGFFRSVWGGESPSLLELLAAQGVGASLVTDDQEVATFADALGFDEIRRIDFSSDQSAETVADTELAQLFAVAIDQLAGWADAPAEETAPSPRRLLWLHARGYRGAWDAPGDYRDSLLEDEDPAAPTFVLPPAMEAVSDHDALLQYRAAYAAQTLVLDECVAALLAAIDEFGLAANTVVMLVGTRGFALGEHGVVGADAGSLYSELLHVPCLVRLPGAEAPPPRWAGLVSPADLNQLLRVAFQPAEGDPFTGLAVRQLVFASNEAGELAVRTPAWMLRLPAPGRPGTLPQVPFEGGATAELYVKPDDRWEANEIANRMPEVTSRLLAVLDAAHSGDLAGIVALDDDLIGHGR